jgi:hypothetical protein
LQDAPNAGAANRKVELVEFSNDSAIPPTEVLSREPEDDPASNDTDPWASNWLRFCAAFILTSPAPIGLGLHNRNNVLDVVAEFLSDGQQAVSILRRRDHAITVEFGSQDINLGKEEAYSRIATRGLPLKEEVQDNIDPA